MVARRLASVVVLWLCSLACVALGAAPALGARRHIFRSSFAGPGAGNGQLSQPSGVAVNESTHDVYVVDAGNNRVEEFSSAGSFIGQFNGSVAPTGQFSQPTAVAVDNSKNALDPSAGDVYVVDSGHKVIDKFSSSGAYIGQITGTSVSSPFKAIEGVAVDNTGTVWVDVRLLIDKFNDAVVNEFQSSITPQIANEPRFAVDSEDNFYIGYLGNEFVPIISKLSSTGSLVTFEVDVKEPATAVAVDLSNNDAYIDDGAYIGRYSSGGTPLERFGSGVLGSGTGVAVDSSSGLVYVADAKTDVIDVFELEPVAAPVVEGESITDVTSTSATFNAEVNARDLATEYRFEYGTSDAYGTSFPVPEGALAAEFGPVVVPSIRIEGLQPGTTYHYRVVAHNSMGTMEGADHTFTTQSIGGGHVLPDGRTWELVSPANKRGAVIEPTYLGGLTMSQSATDGDAIAYLTLGPLPENPEGKAFFSQALSRRGVSGWSTQDLTLQLARKEGQEASFLFEARPTEYAVFSADLSVAFVQPPFVDSPPLAPEATERTLYLRNNTSGSFTPLVTPSMVPAGTKYGPETSGGSAQSTQMYALAATPDLSTVVFVSPFALTSEAVSESICNGCFSPFFPWNIYTWSNRQLQLVNILPNGTATRKTNGVNLAGTPGDSQGGQGSAPRSISTDGHRVAWMIGEPYQKGSTVTLYIRDLSEKRTVLVGGEKAAYQTMSVDGTKTFFLEHGELYDYEWPRGAATGTQVDLTANHGAGESSGGVQELVDNVSEDGSYVYFVAKGVLAAGGVSGGDNLYLLHDTGSDWSTTYIATLSSEDEKSWYGRGFAEIPAISHVTSRVSPDGRYLAFMSNRPLTSYDNTDAVSGEPDEEVYRYDATAASLVCVSCNPTGARPVGVHDTNTLEGELLVDRSDIWASEGTGVTAGNHWLAGSLPGWDQDKESHSFYQPRYLSDSGRVFFNSPDALVPQDTNGLEDVYEYEPPGVGDCTTGSRTFSPRSQGCVNLITSGTSSAESAFVDASENGDDVFFVTASKLVSEDYDTSNDLYDAHVCSSASPCLSAPVTPPPCTSGDSCKGAPTPQPAVFGASPSATFSGVGNVTAKQTVTVKSLTRTQKLDRALRACKKMRSKRKRAVCERHAKAQARRARNAKATVRESR